MGHQAGAPEGSTCHRCADRQSRIEELKGEVAYLRDREERATEALLMKAAGMVGVARQPPPGNRNQVAGAMAALRVTEVSSKPGQGEMSGAH